jgi:hypothetical protein
MSRRRKRRADGGFVMVSRQLTRSAAFLSLRPPAVALLLGLMDRYDGDDNRVPMSRREAERWLKSGSYQVAAAFHELEAKGLVRCHQAGGFTCKVRIATVWELTMYGRHGQPATLDFLKWQGQPLTERKTQTQSRKKKYGCPVDTNTGVPSTPMDRATGVPSTPDSETYGCPVDTNTGVPSTPLYRSTIPGTGLLSAYRGRATLHRRVLALLRQGGPCTVKDIKAAFDITNGEVHRALGVLLETGEAVRVAYGQYRAGDGNVVTLRRRGAAP